ncbi:MAG: exodeoxyribonuclease V subunit alpha [Lacrimispora sp.]
MMKKQVAEKLQKVLVKVSINSIGRSIPATIYERKIPDAVLKMRNENSK